MPKRKRTVVRRDYTQELLRVARRSGRQIMTSGPFNEETGTHDWPVTHEPRSPRDPKPWLSSSGSFTVRLGGRECYPQARFCVVEVEGTYTVQDVLPEPGQNPLRSTWRQELDAITDAAEMNRTEQRLLGMKV